LRTVIAHLYSPKVRLLIPKIDGKVIPGDGMQKLTEAEVAALPVDGRDRIVFDTMLSGFAVRVTPAGRKIFLVQASGGGRSRKVSIGQHPDMTVADARGRRVARSTPSGPARIPPVRGLPAWPRMPPAP
jgi:hypothetical protein